MLCQQCLAKSREDVRFGVQDELGASHFWCLFVDGRLNISCCMRVAGLWVVVVCRGWALVCLMDLRKGKALLGLVEAGTNSKSRDLEA